MTKSYVVLDRDLFLASRERLLHLDHLTRELRDQRDAEHQMLIAALAQLAVATGSLDKEFFIRRWLREWRGEPLPRSYEKSRRRRANGHS